MNIIPISFQIGARWYLVRTQRNRETQAEAVIRAMGIETYLPKEHRWARHARKTYRREAPVFRQYLFTRFDPGLDDWGEIDRARYVDRLMKQDEIPLRVPDKAVERVRWCEQNGLYDFTKEAFPAGSMVRITEGPFADFCATVIRGSSRDRIECLLAVLGKVSIERLHLERV